MEYTPEVHTRDGPHAAAHDVNVETPTFPPQAYLDVQDSFDGGGGMQDADIGDSGLFWIWDSAWDLSSAS